MTRIQESKIGAWADASPQRGRDERRPLASACGLRSVEAFTLIEIMVVVGIIGIVMAI